MNIFEVVRPRGIENRTSTLAEEDSISMLQRFLYRASLLRGGDKITILTSRRDPMLHDEEGGGRVGGGKVAPCLRPLVGGSSSRTGVSHAFALDTLGRDNFWFGMLPLLK